MKRLFVALAVALASAPSVRADGNLAANPNFDTDLSSWFNGNPTITSVWDSRDVVDSATSGSAQVTSAQVPAGGVGNSGSGLIQCIDIGAPGAPRGFLVSASYFIPSGQDHTATPDISVSWFPDPGCTNYESDPHPDGKIPQGDSTTDTWLQLQGTVTSPLTSQSLRIFLRPRKVEAAGSVDVLFDAVFLPEPDAAALGVAALATIGLLTRKRSVSGR